MFDFSELIKRISSHGVQYGLLIRIGIAVVILIAQIFLIKGIWALLRLLREKIDVLLQKKIKPIGPKNLQLFLIDQKQLKTVFDLIIKLIKFVITAAFLIFTIPIILSLFEPTHNLASTLFGYILTPLKNFALAVLKYIPNIISIIVIIFIARYTLRILKFFTKQIASGRIKIKGFYEDWAEPTFNILRILIYAFTVAMVFPQLPGADSRVFQGVSVLLGILFSLGSSSAIGNLVAGIVLTYMRTFKIGDRIKINDVVGFVVEKTPVITRVRTHKNEFISFPNQMVLNAIITNYNSSAEEKEPGLILHTDVTFDYDTPWQKIESLLLTAAAKTPLIEKEPAPYVLQKALGDFFCTYEINAYTKDIKSIITTYTELHKNIQSEFTAAGLDLTSPYFYNGAAPKSLPRETAPAEKVSGEKTSNKKLL